MREETALGSRQRGVAGDASPLHAGARSRLGSPKDGPRHEIWFRRRVSLIPAMRELWAFRELVLTLAERDLRVRYKQAVLGIAWAVITPMVMMLAFTLIFTKFAHVKTGGVPYALFSYMGLLPWTFFSAALTPGGMSLVGNVPLLNKLYCPREVFPIAGIVDAVVDALIATARPRGPVPDRRALRPRRDRSTCRCCCSCWSCSRSASTLAVSAIVVYMRDLRLVLPLVIQIGLFVTPVVYGSQLDLEVPDASSSSTRSSTRSCR